MFVAEALFLTSAVVCCSVVGVSSSGQRPATCAVPLSPYLVLIYVVLHYALGSRSTGLFVTARCSLVLFFPPIGSDESHSFPPGP